VTDRDREELIEAYRLVLTLEGRSDYKDAAMQRMRELIAERPPKFVELMERERGLRAS